MLKPVLTSRLTFEQTTWAQQYPWYVARGLDIDGYYVLVKGRNGNLTIRSWAVLRSFQKMKEKQS